MGPSKISKHAMHMNPISENLFIRSKFAHSFGILRRSTKIKDIALLTNSEYGLQKNRIL